MRCWRLIINQTSGVMLMVSAAAAAAQDNEKVVAG